MVLLRENTNCCFEEEKGGGSEDEILWEERSEINHLKHNGRCLLAICTSLKKHQLKCFAYFFSWVIYLLYYYNICILYILQLYIYMYLTYIFFILPYQIKDL